MIAYVSGVLVEKKPTHVVVEVGGLGYSVSIPTSTFEALPEAGAKVKLLTYFAVREDAQLLYGFATQAERELFEALISVSGVGPKLALAALSALPPAELQRRILEGDAAMLVSIPGVGRKTAERLVVDLRDRVARMELDGGGALAGDDGRTQARQDALAALEALGLSRAAAERNLRKVLRTNPGIQTAEELIRLSLREG